MTSTRPVLGCVRSTVGLGFLHTCMMGIFLAAPTYLVSPVDFAGNPVILLQTIMRYKIKDTYATSQMLDHAIANHGGKGVTLHDLKNLMIATDQRPKPDVYQRVRQAFAQSALDRTSINTIYTHVLNPMVASRSYMCIEPIELYLDPTALRRGLIVPVDPDQEPFALLVQDSGMVPVSTQISIVNPETNHLCLVGEYGEIWVQSEANAYSFYGSKDAFDAERFNGRTVDGDPAARYVRTGDLGFLHNVHRPIGPGGSMVEMQVLFVLGSIGETFEVNGLQHFPMDVEASIERCHRALVKGGCAIFQAGSLLVLVAEVRTRAFLASLVPVIVNAALNEHQLVLDIVAFVAMGDFTRSRLGEKQRGKILASWVSRKMRTIAQFSIRDADAEGSVGTLVGADRHSRPASMQSNIAPGGARKSTTSLRQVESISHIPTIEPPLIEGEQLTLQTTNSYEVPPHPDAAQTFSPATFASENDNTPTNEYRPAIHLNTTLDYSPVEQFSPNELARDPLEYTNPRSEWNQNPHTVERRHQESPVSPIERPHLGGYTVQNNTNNNTGSQYSPLEATPPPVGGLRIANRSSDIDEGWAQEALQHMNIKNSK